jgi:prephenate dehydrogenase
MTQAISPPLHLGLIGCGLMGASLALAARQAGLVSHITAYDRAPEHLDWGQKHHVIDTVATDLPSLIRHCDCLVLAIPVGAIRELLPKIGPYLMPHTCVMDMGSTKADVVAAAQSALGSAFSQFVGTHPIAGRAESGPQAAQAHLFEGCQVVLTPTPETSPQCLTQVQQWWTALGAQVVQQSPQTHDEAMAAVSHLPHLLAFALMNSLGQQAQAQTLLALAGPGFRDFSRIAGADPVLWRDVLEANAGALLQQLDAFETQLRQVRHWLTNPSNETHQAALLSWIQIASQTRQGLFSRKA